MLKFIHEYYYIFGLIPVIFYLIHRKRLIDKRLRVIVFLLVIGFLADVYSQYLSIKGKPNFIVYNLFILFETLLLLVYYFHLLSSKVYRTVIIILSTVFTLVFIYEYIKSNGSKKYLDIFAVVGNIVIIILSIAYFFKQISSPENLDFYKNPRFWVVSAYLIYSAGTLFLFLYISTLSMADQQRDYILNYIFLIPKSILLSIAMFMKNTFQTRKKFQLT